MSGARNGICWPSGTCQPEAQWRWMMVGRAWSLSGRQTEGLDLQLEEHEVAGTFPQRKPSAYPSARSVAHQVKTRWTIVIKERKYGHCMHHWHQTMSCVLQIFNHLPAEPTRYTLLGLLTVGIVLGSGFGGCTGSGHNEEMLPVIVLLSSSSPFSLSKSSSSSSSDELPDWTSRLARSTASWIRRENSPSARRQPSISMTQNGVLCSPYLSKQKDLCPFCFLSSPPMMRELNPGNPNWHRTCRTPLLGQPTLLAPAGGPGPRIERCSPGRLGATPGPSAALDSYGDTWNVHHTRDQWATLGIKSQKGNNLHSLWQLGGYRTNEIQKKSWVLFPALEMWQIHTSFSQ